MQMTITQPVVPCAPATDWGALIEAIARREQSALADLYDQTHRQVFSLLCQMLGERGLAEQALVAVYQQVWQEAAQFAQMCQRPLTWLMLLARRHALAQRQTQAGKEARQALPSLCQTPATTSETEPFATERQRVRAALGQLTPEQRQAIEVAFYTGLTEAEIATQLGTSRDIVRARISAGMRALKASLHS